PRDLRRLMQAARRGRLRTQIEVTSLKAFGDQINSAANRLTVGVITAALIIGSSIVMNSVGGGVSNRGLMTLGVLGFVGAALSGVWIVFSLWPSNRHKESIDIPALVAILLTMDLTTTQRDILVLIAERSEAEGVPPSQAEIARAFG